MHLLVTLPEMEPLVPSAPTLPPRLPPTLSVAYWVQRVAVIEPHSLSTPGPQTVYSISGVAPSPSYITCSAARTAPAPPMTSAATAAAVTIACRIVPPACVSRAADAAPVDR